MQIMIKCRDYPQCGCTNGSCGHAGETEGYIKCRLESAVRIATEDARKRRLAKEHARMAFSSAIKAMRVCEKGTPEYEAARAVYTDTRGTYGLMSKLSDAAEAALSEAKKSLRAADEAKLSEARRNESVKAKEWKQACKAARVKKTNPTGKKLRFVQRGAVRAPCGVLCADTYTMVTHRLGCDECRSIPEGEQHGEDIIEI